MRPLQADEIEVRIGQIYDGKCTMLLYKNARVDMAILDETYGEMGWQDRYEERKNIMYCSIGVWDDSKKQWIWKEDCGTESNTEKEKGEASDAFKRAGFRWGIGRELYTAPPIWLEVATDKIGDNRYKLHSPRELRGIFVSHIKTEEVNGKLKITELQLSQKAQKKVMAIYQWKER